MAILTLSELVEQESELLALPHTVQRIIATIDSPDADLDELARLVSQDIVLTVKLLRLVNSPYYGLSARIDSVKQAISLVGNKALRDLVIATKVAERFNGLPENLVSMRTFWDNALFGATMARAIARKSGVVQETIFATSLLRDVGALLMLWKMPKEMTGALLKGRHERQEIYKLEEEWFGYSHAEVGERLMQAWGLPELFSVVCRYHHEFYKAPRYKTEAAIVHLANAIAHHHRPWVNYRGLRSVQDLAAFSLIDVSSEMLEQVADEVSTYPHAGAMFN